MARIVLLLFVLAFMTPAHSEETVWINSAQDTGQIEVLDTSLTAFFQSRDRALDVTLILEDEEGSVLRSRILLQDGQRHELRLTSDAGLPGSHFTIARHGPSVSLSAAAHPGPAIAVTN